jgi:hypothetical protein
MTEATEFRQYAREAMREASFAISKNDKQSLSDLACIWAQAAEASERLWSAPELATPHSA